MARMPGARWRPLANNWASQPRMSRYDLVIIHTAVGSFEGTFSWFSNSGGYVGAESHFMTSGAGDIDQYQDTARQAEANGAANPRAVSVENADMGPGFPAWNTRDGNAVPAFTAAQIEANARICAWAHLTHGVPLVAADTSRPNARGIGFHRLGVDPYRVPDGERWSSSYGKTCPAPRRIAQIPQIIARARQIVGAGTTTPTPPAPAPVVVPKEAVTMRSVQLTADQPAAVLTVDAVGTSAVMPKGAKAWLQGAAFMPDQVDGKPAKALLQWLVCLDAAGKSTRVEKPVEIIHRWQLIGFELPAGTSVVELRVTGIPKGGVVGFHIDGVGHA